MPLDQIDVRSLRRTMQVELERQKKRTRNGLFLAHLLVTILFVIIAWGLIGSDLAQPSDEVIAMIIMLTSGLLLGLFFHALSLGIEHRMGQGQLRERAMARALDLEMQRLGIEDEEPADTKRKRLMTLSDDGELVEESVDDAPENSVSRGS